MSKERGIFGRLISGAESEVTPSVDSEVIADDREVIANDGEVIAEKTALIVDRQSEAEASNQGEVETSNQIVGQVTSADKENYAFEVLEIKDFCIHGWGHENGRPLVAIDAMVEGEQIPVVFVRNHMDGLSIDGAVEGDLHGFSAFLPPHVNWEKDEIKLSLISNASTKEVEFRVEEVAEWCANYSDIPEYPYGEDLQKLLRFASHARHLLKRDDLSEETVKTLQRYTTAANLGPVTYKPSDLPEKEDVGFEEIRLDRLFNEKRSSLGGELSWEEIKSLANLFSLPASDFQEFFLINANVRNAKSVVSEVSKEFGYDNNYYLLLGAYVDALNGNYDAAASRLYQLQYENQWVSIEVVARICDVLVLATEQPIQAEDNGGISEAVYGVLHVAQNAIHHNARAEDIDFLTSFIKLSQVAKSLSPWLYEDIRRCIKQSYSFSRAFWICYEKLGADLGLPEDIRTFFRHVCAVFDNPDAYSSKQITSLLLQSITFAANGYVRADMIMNLLCQKVLEISDGSDDADSAVALLRSIADIQSWGHVTKLMYMPSIDLVTKRKIFDTYKYEIESYVLKETMGDFRLPFQVFRGFTADFKAAVELAAEQKPLGKDLVFRIINSLTDGMRMRYYTRFFASYAAELAAHAFVRKAPDLIALASRVLSIMSTPNVREDLHGQALHDLLCVTNLIVRQAPKAGKSAGVLRELVIASNRVGAVLMEDGGSDRKTDDKRAVEHFTRPQKRIAIAIYSCAKYLPTRVQNSMKAWGHQAIKEGFDLFVFTGDMEKQFENHIPLPNVLDDYENLPQKTLALAKWLLDSDYDYVYKVDDDCFVDTKVLADLSVYKNGDYVGRILDKTTDNFDRVWHQQKSKSALAKNSIDMSPIPARCLDGGGGYFLSRYAVEKLKMVASTDAGNYLIQTSYFEDKMLGDLLAMAGITPTDVCYQTHQFRRNLKETSAVSQYSNFHYSDEMNHISLIHTDDEPRIDMHTLSEFNPSPQRITMATKPIKFGSNSEQLELIKHATTDTSEGVVLVACVRNEVHILHHFFRHYRALGVKHFCIVDNLSTDGTLSYLMEQPDATVYSVDSEYRLSHFGVDWQRALLEHHGLGRWCLIADADEFIDLPEGHTEFGSICSLAEQEGADAFRVIMCDMYPKERLSEVDISTDEGFAKVCYTDEDPVQVWHLSKGVFSNSTDLKSAVRHRVTGVADGNMYTSVKYCLLKFTPFTVLTEGIHDTGGIKVSQRPLVLRHLKYHKEFMNKVNEEVIRKQHFGDASEYNTYKERIARHGDAFMFEGSVEVKTPAGLYEVVEDALRQVPLNGIFSQKSPSDKNI